MSSRCFPSVLGWMALSVLLASPASASTWVLQNPSPSDSAQAHRDARAAVETYVRSVVQAPGLRTRGEREFRREVIEEERPEVIDALDAAATVAPGDDWITGHRVGFRIKEGELDQALHVARTCQASEWWCQALEGTVRQIRGQSLAAHEAFEAALGAMTEEQRCAWDAHVQNVARYQLSGHFADADCQELRHLTDRYWWLGEPFHMEEWNNRRSTHFARTVGVILRQQLDELQRAGGGSPEPYAEALRRGWPEWWWSYEAEPFSSSQRGERFLPTTVDKVEEPFRIEAGDWDFIPRDEEDERADLGYDIIHPLPHQTAFFRRNGEIRALVAADTDAHELRGSWSLEFGVALSPDPHERHIERMEGEPDRFVVEMDVPHDSYLVSVEAMAERSGTARSRFGHELPEPTDDGDLAISDLVLFDWREDVDEELGSVTPLMLGTDRVERSWDLGIFWETYGADEGDALEVAFSAQPLDQGRLRRFGEWVGVSGPEEAVRYTWEEVVPERHGEEGRHGRALQVDLSPLEAGHYLLRLEVEDEGDGAVVAERRVQVRDF